MKKGSGRRGFAMLEAMAAIAVLMAVAASVLASVSAVNRREIRKIEKYEAQDAALAVVRLMADEVMNGRETMDGREAMHGRKAEDLAENVQLMEDGMEARETRIVITPKNGDAPFSVPVTVWTEREGCRLILYAESVVDGQREAVSLVLEAEEALESPETPEDQETLESPEALLSTPSSAAFAGDVKWKIIRYNKVN